MPTSYYPAVSDRSNINQLRFQQSYPATRMDTFSVVVVGSIELMKSCFDITSALLSESRHQHIREQFGELHDLLSTVEGACPDGQRRDVDSQVHSLARDIQKQTGVLHDLLRNFAGACPGGQRHLEDSKIHTLAQDLEQAEKCQTASFEFAISQEIRPQKQWRRRGMTRLRLVRSLAGASLMYPVCMLIMSNYAVTRGLLQGCSRLELHPLGHQLSLLPQCMLRPSPLAFFSASFIWTSLEYIHYHSNVGDEFQKKILVGAVVVGLLLCVGRTWNALGVLIQTMPWIIHTGLLISDILHGIWAKQSNTTTSMASL